MRVACRGARAGGTFGGTLRYGLNGRCHMATRWLLALLLAPVIWPDPSSIEAYNMYRYFLEADALIETTDLEA